METEPSLDPDRDVSRAYGSAIRMLGGREHGVAELKGKLQKKYPNLPEPRLSGLIDELIQDGYLSDTRYVETLVRSRVGRGYGPFYIHQELRNKGVHPELVHEHLEAWSDEWHQLALELVQRRHPQVNQDLKAWNKAVRFLQRRGFSGDVVAAAVGDRPSDRSEFQP